MKKYSIAILTAVFGMAAFAMAAKAGITSDQLLIKVPYDFVVGSKTLPAGTYRVSRVSSDTEGELVISGVDHHVGALVHANMWEDARSYGPKFQFEPIAGQHFLSEIQTGEHVYTIPVSQSAVMEAMKSHQGSTTSTTSGAN
jgi:hypothetical protein